jgi:hypothetical protein
MGGYVEYLLPWISNSAKGEMPQATGKTGEPLP